MLQRPIPRLKTLYRSTKRFYQTKDQVLETIQRDKQVLLQLYQRPDLIFTHGKGCLLTDSTGQTYLDLTAGIAVNALGHANDTIRKAILEQTDKLIHLSNLYHNEHAGDLARMLVNSIERPSKVFLCNSGTEANEAAIKFARKWGNLKSNGKHRILSFNNGFHGRSMGSLSATPSQKYQKPFTPMLPGFEYAVFNDVASFQDKMGPDVCAVLLEPIQGEGGIHVASQEFMECVQKKCAENDALMIVDEIQAGLGRTGKMFAHQWFTGIQPDMITLAKPLANGIPSGAVIVSDHVAATLNYGDHGTTFGGSPFSCAVAKAVVSVIQSPSFLKHVSEVGQYFKTELQEIAAASPIITAIRGHGLLLGMQLHEKVETKLFVDLCRERRLLVVGAGCNTVRFVPPLIITKDQIKAALTIIDQVIGIMESMIARGQDQK